MASLPAKRITCELAILRVAQSTVVRDFSDKISLPSKLVKVLAKFVKRHGLMVPVEIDYSGGAGDDVLTEAHAAGKDRLVSYWPREAVNYCGYTQEQVDTNFAGMINAFKFGAPPHGGSAPGVDRIVMLLADEPNIREVIVFPMNQKAEDLMMQAPSFVSDKQLKELHIRLAPGVAPTE